MSITEPIFIHSLFRAAGCYFVQKIRSLGSDFTCYQQPFNEALVALNSPARYERLLQSRGCPSTHAARAAQPPLYEFWLRRRQLRGLFRESFSYQQYFLGDEARLPLEQLAYLSALIEHAQGRAVLQFYRSSGRAQALQRQLGGVHIHLWREPRVQWWSYKAAQYFDEVCQRIYLSDHLPQALRRIGALAGIGRAPVRYLTARENYLMFYGLWLDAWLRLRSHAELSISLDGISLSRRENLECSRQLGELTGGAFDLSDACASGMAFTSDEEEFYAEVEHTVNLVFVETGRGTVRSVEAADDAARNARRAHEHRHRDRLAERNLRQTALSMMQGWVEHERARRQWSANVLAARLCNYWRSFRKIAPPAAGATEGTAALGSAVEPTVAAERLR